MKKGDERKDNFNNISLLYFREFREDNKCFKNFFLFKSKRAQVTIFIIVAIVIIGLGFLFYFLFPGARLGTTFDERDPNAFIQTCLESKIREVVDLVSKQGGSIRPGFYFTYNEIPIEYLCYTNQHNALCVIQQPLLKEHIESEIKNEIQNDVVSCFNSLKQSYERRGYNVQMQSGDTHVELLPKKIVMSFRYVVTATRGETRRHEDFSVILNNNLYELISIAGSIINFEAAYGDADPTIYMTLYPELKVEKNIRDDGTKIYTITHRNSGNKFQFASRSFVILPGY